MTITRIDTTDLKSEGGDLIKELADFIKERTSGDVETATNDIKVKGEGRTTSRAYIRLLLRKFLHIQGLKEYFRILGEKENTFIIKEIKIAEEE